MVALPLVARVVSVQPSPRAPPLAIQDVALTELQVSVVACPDMIVVGDAASATVKGG
jgi:hypothetical protein